MTQPGPVLTEMSRPRLQIAESRLVIGATLVLLIPLLVADLLYGITLPRTWLGGLDLRVYLAGAQIGLRDGWAHLYDRQLQQALILPYFRHASGFPRGFWTPYVTPPPVAFILAGVAGLPFTPVWTAWAAVLTVLVAAGAVVMGGRSWRSQLFTLAFLLAVPSIVFGIVLGNIWALLFAAVAVAWRLASDRRSLAAGAILGLLVLKPQLALLVIPGLAAGRYWRILLGFATTASVVAAWSLVLLGLSGVREWISLTSFVSTFPDETKQSVLHLMPGTGAEITLGVLVAVGVVLVADGFRRTGAGFAIAAGLIGSFLISPYLNAYDLGVLCAAGLITVRSSTEPPMQLIGWLLVASTTVSGVGGTVLPAALCGAGVLGILSVSAVKLRLSQPGQAELAQRPV